jgi:hypothetical protein
MNNAETIITPIFDDSEDPDDADFEDTSSGLQPQYYYVAGNVSSYYGNSSTVIVKPKNSGSDRVIVIRLLTHSPYSY